MKESIRVKVLRQAKRILSKKSAWTRHCLAVDKFGLPVLPTSSKAVAFCMLGAVSKAKHDLGVGTSACSALYKVIPTGLVGTFNDNPSTTHEDVLRMFDKAIIEELRNHE